MSSLISDLNSIYEIKQQIKEVAYIESDVFSEYPGYIAAAIASGGATGTIELDANGTHNVSTYEYAYVNVPQQEVPVVPPGYTYVQGSYNVTANGENVDISSYAYINVSVPAPEGWIYPSGYAYITTNGDFNIREFESVTVAVPEGGITPEGTSYITINGVYNIGTYAYVDVDVQGGFTPSGYAYIINNGDYDISSYAMVNVAVPQGGGGTNYVHIDPTLNPVLSAGDCVEFTTWLSNEGYPVDEVLSEIPELASYTGCYVIGSVTWGASSNRKSMYVVVPEYGTYETNTYNVLIKGSYITNYEGYPIFASEYIDVLYQGGVEKLVNYSINNRLNIDTSKYQSVDFKHLSFEPGAMLDSPSNEGWYLYVIGDNSTNKYYYLTAGVQGIPSSWQIQLDDIEDYYNFSELGLCILHYDGISTTTYYKCVNSSDLLASSSWTSPIVLSTSNSDMIPWWQGMIKINVALSDTSNNGGSVTAYIYNTHS